VSVFNFRPLGTNRYSRVVARKSVPNAASAKKMLNYVRKQFLIVAENRVPRNCREWGPKMLRRSLRFSRTQRRQEPGGGVFDAGRYSPASPAAFSIVLECPAIDGKAEFRQGRFVCPNLKADLRGFLVSGSIVSSSAAPS